MATGLGILSSLAGPIIQGVTSLFGSGAAIKASNDNLKAVRETNEANLNLAKMQNDWNVDMWNKTNEYNTPAEKLKRLLEAGLNPMLYSLDGVANAGQVQSANLANQVAPQQDAVGLGNMINNAGNNLANSVLKEKEIKIANKTADALIRKLTADTEYIKSQKELVDVQVKNKQREYDDNHELSEENKKVLKAQEAKLGEEKKKLIEEQEVLRLNVAESKVRVDKMEFDKAMDKARYELEKSVAASTIAVNNRNIEHMDAIDENLRESAKKIVEETINEGKKGVILDAEAALKSVESEVQSAIKLNLIDNSDFETLNMYRLKLIEVYMKTGDMVNAKLEALLLVNPNNREPNLYQKMKKGGQYWLNQFNKESSASWTNP